MAVALFIKPEDVLRNSIMDGNINQFIRAYLLNSIKNEIRENE